MPRKLKSSSGNTHPYLTGYKFWNVQRYWHNPTSLISQAGKDYLDSMVDDMQQNEKKLTKLSAE